VIVPGLGVEVGVGEGMNGVTVGSGVSVKKGVGVATGEVAKTESVGDARGDDRGEAPGIDRHPLTSNRNDRSMHLSLMSKRIRFLPSITL
jgi:hypothetical protein